MSPGLVYGLIFFASLMAVMFAFEAWKHRREMRNRAPPMLIPREDLAGMGVPSVVLAATREPAFSKIGGAPELPVDLAWPAGEKGPREFLIQIDLAEARSWGRLEWLPSAGRIYVFHDEELSEFVIEPEPVGREGVHRMGGFPSEIQSGQMNVECEYLARGLEMNYQDPIPDEIREAAKTWRMLLQIDSDRDLKMNWWDSGRFYIFIREQDARAGDFSKTVTISQCY